MDIRSVYSLPIQRLRSTRVDRNILPPNSHQDAASIRRSLFERSIAMNGADAKQV